MKMQGDRISLEEISLEDKNTILLFDRIIKEDKANKYIWDVSEKALLWDSLDELKEYLKKDFGLHKIYKARYIKKTLGVLGMLNMFEKPESSNVILWLDEQARKKIFLMRWVILFLREAQKNNIARFFASIKLRNAVSINTAKKLGFIKCENSQRHLLSKDPIQGAICLTRKTEFNCFEVKYISRYFGQFTTKKPLLIKSV